MVTVQITCSADSDFLRDGDCAEIVSGDVKDGDRVDFRKLV